MDWLAEVGMYLLMRRHGILGLGRGMGRRGRGAGGGMRRQGLEARCGSSGLLDCL